MIFNYQTTLTLGPAKGEELIFTSLHFTSLHFTSLYSLGVAFDSLVAPVHAAVSMLGKSAVVTILPETGSISQVTMHGALMGDTE